jgi:hypothetical protein
MAFPPAPIADNVSGPILNPGDHPGHHNALAAAINDTVIEVGTKVTATSTLTKLHGPITQAAYDALTPASDTFYVIVG